MLPVRMALPCALAIAVVFAGCGKGSSNTPNPSGSFPNVSGNYDLTAQSQTASSTSYIGGSLTTDGNGNVSGIVHILSLTSSCYDSVNDVPVSGTTTKAGQLTITSAAVVGQVVTVNGTVSADGSTISNATYSVAGGCANGDHGSIIGSRVQSFSGNYSGTFTSNSGGTVKGTGTLTQSAAPDPHGFYAITGSVAFTGSSCFTTATVQNSGSDVAGFLMLLNLSANDGSTIQFGGIASDATTKTIAGNYSVSGGNCNGDSGQATLTH